MPTSRKQPKTNPADQPQPDGSKITPESTVSIALNPDEPPAAAPEPPLDTMTLAAEDERPGIDSVFPPNGYAVPASGVVAASVSVSRSAAGIPLGRVEWSIDNQLVGTDRVPRDAATWDRSEEHTSELQSLRHIVCRLLL